MEKDIGKLNKNDNTDIVIRVDDFGGKRGLTIREYVNSDRYTGFTKAGTRISGADFPKFKEMINSIDEEEMQQPAEGSEDSGSGNSGEKQPEKGQSTLNSSSDSGNSSEESSESQSGNQEENKEDLPDY